MENIIITISLNEPQEFSLVGEDCAWGNTCKHALVDGKKQTTKTIPLEAGSHTVEYILLDKKIIGDNMFEGMPIDDIVVPKGIKVIGDHAFANCLSLKNIEISNTVNTLGDGCFEGCKSLKSIHIPKSVEKCSNWIGILKDSGVESVTFDEGITVVPDALFYSLGSCPLNPIIPEGVTSIKCDTLSGLSKQSVTLPESLIEVEADAMKSSFPHLEVPASVKCLRSSFEVHPENKASLGFTPLGDSIEEICLDSFNSDTLFIPANVRRIHIENSIYGLIRIFVDPANPVYDSRENCNALIETATNTMILATPTSTIPEGIIALDSTSCNIVRKDGSLPQLPSSLEKIDFKIKGASNYTLTPNLNEYSFESGEAGKVINVTIMQGATIIPHYAFSHVKQLCLNLPASIETIGDSAFEYCSLQELSSDSLLPESLRKIGECAFKEMGLKGVITIPTGVTEIGKSAFEGNPDIEDIVLPESLEVLNNIWPTLPAKDAHIKGITVPANVKKLDHCLNKAIKKVTFLSPEPPKFVFEKNDDAVPSKGTFIVPEGASKVYIKCISKQNALKGWTIKEAKVKKN